MRRFNSILCVVDPDSDAETAIVQAMRIAEDHQAKVTVASIVEVERTWRGIFKGDDEFHRNLDLLKSNKRKVVERKIAEFAPGSSCTVEIYSGVGFLEIIKSVVSDGYDLVVKCAEEAEWLDRMFGSEDMHLLRKCPCPVLMLKPGKHDRFRHILATVDVSEDSPELEKQRVQKQLNVDVLDYAATLCVPELGSLHVGCAWEAYAEDFYRYGAFSHLPEKEVDQYVEQVRREYENSLHALIGKMAETVGQDAMRYLSPELHMVKGRAQREIPRMAEAYAVDLVVMGTVARVGIPGLIIGNTAESILEQVECSVLAIKPAGFQTPVK